MDAVRDMAIQGFKHFESMHQESSLEDVDEIKAQWESWKKSVADYNEMNAWLNRISTHTLKVSMQVINFLQHWTFFKRLHY